MILAEVIAAYRESSTEADWRMGVFLSRYGRCLAQLDRYAEVEAALEEAYPLLRDSVGEQHEYTRRAVEGLAELYEARGQPDAAAAWRSRL